MQKFSESAGVSLGPVKLGLHLACSDGVGRPKLKGDADALHTINRCVVTMCEGRDTMKDQSESLTFDITDFLPFQMSVIASRVFQTIMDESGLQVPEWRILMALPAHQPCSSHDLCILTAMDAARVSRAQRRLEDLKMISVVRDQADRRRLVVRLSDKGTSEVGRLKGAARAAEASMLQDLEPEDRANLQTAINGLFGSR